MKILLLDKFQLGIIIYHSQYIGTNSSNQHTQTQLKVHKMAAWGYNSNYNNNEFNACFIFK